MSSFSYQLYSSRNFPTISDTFDMLQSLGYVGGEGYGGLYTSDESVAALAKSLKQTGLTMRSAHMGLDQIENDPQSVLNICKSLGIEMVFVPHLAQEDRPSDAAGWAEFGRRLAIAGAPFWDAGLVFGWHNHDFEFVALPDGSLPIDHMLGADERLQFEFDVAWAVRAGSDPFTTINKYKSRIKAAHVKDIAADGQNQDEDGWADVGLGVMDWPSIYTALIAVGTDHFVMEHDNPNDDKRFAANAIASAKSF